MLHLVGDMESSSWWNSKCKSLIAPREPQEAALKRNTPPPP